MVSLPLLLTLILDWLWRLVLWTGFLWRVSRLDLALVPVHPDRCSGLRFVGESVQAFSGVGLALGVIVAGTVANRLRDGAETISFTILVLCLIVLVLSLFVCPLLAFSMKLLQSWRRGVFEYGALSARVGRVFEDQWCHRRIDDTALSAPDFSATTDLYQIASNVGEPRIIPVGLIGVAILIAATLLPFAAVVAMFTPVDVILEHVAGFLL
jgi:hypothetical protein